VKETVPPVSSFNADFYVAAVSVAPILYILIVVQFGLLRHVAESRGGWRPFWVLSATTTVLLAVEAPGFIALDQRNAETSTHFGVWLGLGSLIIGFVFAASFALGWFAEKREKEPTRARQASTPEVAAPREERDVPSRIPSEPSPGPTSTTAFLDRATALAFSQEYEASTAYALIAMGREMHAIRSLLNTKPR
jgi:hypothetical protein